MYAVWSFDEKNISKKSLQMSVYKLLASTAHLHWDWRVVPQVVWLVNTLDFILINRLFQMQRLSVLARKGIKEVWLTKEAS